MPRSLLEQTAEETVPSSEKATASAEKEMDDGRKWLIDCKSVFLKTTCEVRENSDGVRRE